MTREEAIEVITDYLNKDTAVSPYNGRFINAQHMAIEALQVEPIKHGYWEEEFNGNGWNDFWDYTCSVCGKKWERADDVLYTSNFCPNCGAKMSRKDDE